MADLTSLLVAELLKQDQQDLADNPLYRGGYQLQTIQPDPKLHLSFGQALLGGLLQGGLGGLMQGFGEAQVQAHQSDVANKLLDALSGPNGTDYSALAADPDLAKYSTLLKFGDAQAAAEKQAKLDELVNKFALERANVKPEPFTTGVEGHPDQIIHGLVDPYTGKFNPIGSVEDKFKSSVEDNKPKYDPQFLKDRGIDPNAPEEQIKFQLSESVRNKIPGKALDDLTHSQSLVSQLDSLNPLIDGMANNNAGRIYNSLSLDTPEGQYQNRLKVLSDELAKQFAGRTSWPSIEQQLSALTVRQLGSKDALKSVVNNMKDMLQNEQDDKASKYGEAGYRALSEIQDKVQPPTSDAEKANSPIDPNNIPPGMKLQRNKVTGEMRLVPL